MPLFPVIPFFSSNTNINIVASFCIMSIKHADGEGLIMDETAPMVSRFTVWLIGHRVVFSTEKIKKPGWMPTVDYETGIPMTVA